MRIFLGSSRESSGLLRLVASWVEDCGHRPIRWDEPGAFPAGNYTLAALRNLARNVDGAVFIFSEDDQIWYRTDKLGQPRDNVLVEYGLFSDALGEHRVAICRSGNPKTASDLFGITYINLADTRLARAERELAAWLDSIAAPDPSIERMKYLMSPFQALGKPSLFRKGTELVRSAKKRLALVAKTPIILMGPRPYDNASDPMPYEIEQYNAYWDVIERKTGRNTPDFLCVASQPCILEELRKYRNTALPRFVHERFIRLDQRSSNLSIGPRVNFACHEDSALMTFVVSDDDFMIWFKDGYGESVWITAKDEVVARALYSQAGSIAENRGVGNMLRELEQLVG